MSAGELSLFFMTVRAHSVVTMLKPRFELAKEVGILSLDHLVNSMTKFVGEGQFVLIAELLGAHDHFVASVLEKVLTEHMLLGHFSIFAGPLMVGSNIVERHRGVLALTVGLNRCGELVGNQKGALILGDVNGKLVGYLVKVGQGLSGGGCFLTGALSGLFEIGFVLLP